MAETTDSTTPVRENARDDGGRRAGGPATGTIVVHLLCLPIRIVLTAVTFILAIPLVRLLIGNLHGSYWSEAWEVARRLARAGDTALGLCVAVVSTALLLEAIPVGLRRHPVLGTAVYLYASLPLAFPIAWASLAAAGEREASSIAAILALVTGTVSVAIYGQKVFLVRCAGLGSSKRTTCSDAFT